MEPGSIIQLKLKEVETYASNECTATGDFVWPGDADNNGIVELKIWMPSANDWPGYRKKSMVTGQY